MERMLYSVPDMRRIERIPHEAEYRQCRDALDRLGADAFRRIYEELSSRFDARQVDTSSWIPGSDWTGTVFQPIYHACHEDEVAAGMFFGLMVWQVVMDREDCWSFGRYEREGILIRGMTYFRIDCP